MDCHQAPVKSSRGGWHGMRIAGHDTWQRIATHLASVAVQPRRISLSHSLRNGSDFSSLVENIVSASVQAASLSIVHTVCIDHWFGHKWLGFTGKLQGAMGVHNTEALRVPPVCSWSGCFGNPLLTQAGRIFLCANPVAPASHPAKQWRQSTASNPERNEFGPVCVVW